MKMSHWPTYSKYIVLADNSRGRLLGTYLSYQNFVTVKDVINNIAFTDKSTYSRDGNIYNRKISSSDAKTILTNIDECKWTNITSKMILVANQLKIRI